MNEYSELLKLIEEVDPSDIDKMDEIDDLVAVYIGLYEWVTLDNGDKVLFGVGWKGRLKERNVDVAKVMLKTAKEFKSDGIIYATDRFRRYTRSRDALKSIRPEGWYIWIQQNGNGYRSHLRDFPFVGNRDKLRSKCFENQFTAPTEELAELHAILQAIAYDRC